MTNWDNIMYESPDATQCRHVPDFNKFPRGKEGFVNAIILGISYSTLFHKISPIFENGAIWGPSSDCQETHRFAGESEDDPFSWVIISSPVIH